MSLNWDVTHVAPEHAFVELRGQEAVDFCTGKHWLPDMKIDDNEPEEISFEKARELIDAGKAEQVYVKALHPMTDACVWWTLAVGMGRITQDNAGEFFARVKLLERLDGHRFTYEGKPYLVQPADIRNRIGLHTNVSTETRAQWLKRLQRDLDDYVRQYNRKED